MARLRTRKVNSSEHIRWVRAIALSLGQDPKYFTILDAQDVSKVNSSIKSFEDYLGL